MTFLIFFTRSAGAGIIGHDLFAASFVSDAAFRNINGLFFGTSHLVISQIQLCSDLISSGLNKLLLFKAVQDILSDFFRAEDLQLFKEGHCAGIGMRILFRDIEEHLCIFIGTSGHIPLVCQLHCARGVPIISGPVPVLSLR